MKRNRSSSVILTNNKTKIETKRKGIPRNLKQDVWVNYYGTNTYGSCYCCKKAKLYFFSAWEMGHVQSAKTGGPDIPWNLRPICSTCNKSMGAENMHTYMTRCGYWIPEKQSMPYKFFTYLSKYYHTKHRIKAVFYVL